MLRSEPRLVVCRENAVPVDRVDADITLRSVSTQHCAIGRQDRLTALIILEALRCDPGLVVGLNASSHVGTHG